MASRQCKAAASLVRLLVNGCNVATLARGTRRQSGPRYGIRPALLGFAGPASRLRVGWRCYCASPNIRPRSRQGLADGARRPVPISLAAVLLLDRSRNEQSADL